jgi:hypothetical protein
LQPWKASGSQAWSGSNNSGCNANWPFRNSWPSQDNCVQWYLLFHLQKKFAPETRKSFEKYSTFRPNYTLKGETTIESLRIIKAEGAWFLKHLNLYKHRLAC